MWEDSICTYTRLLAHVLICVVPGFIHAYDEATVVSMNWNFLLEVMLQHLVCLLKRRQNVFLSDILTTMDWLQQLSGKKNPQALA